MTGQPTIDAAAASEVARQRGVLDFLEHSRFGTAGGGKRIDTHCSVVFLGADRALKIKRAIRLPFLDYSTLERRKDACDEELRVNAANAPELYRRIVPITRGENGDFEIGGAGAPVEWAVEMARFDETQTLDQIAAAKTIDPLLAVATADNILKSHDKAPCADGQTWLSSIPGIIDRNTARFRTAGGIDAAAIDRLASASYDHLARLRSVLDRRAQRGFVRRCHGDLHLANIALIDGRPLLFDAIEFDPVISTTDILYDLAFTLMDLVHFNQVVAANILLNRYLAGSGDENLDGLAALPLFLSMRAAIRAHVLFTKSEQASGGEAVRQEAGRYFDLAGRLVTPKPPLLVAIGGPSGTGKSVLARGLAGLIEPVPGAVIVRSDVVRKRLFGVEETAPLPEHAYRAGITEQVYETLSHTAKRILAHGCTVILDAAFLRREERKEAAALASRQDVRFVGLFLTADLATRLARIEQRTNDASDATREVALEQETFAIGDMDWHVIDAGGTPDDTLRGACIAVLSPEPGASG